MIDAIDRYFGEYFSKTHALFLSYLLNATRAGHLCVYIDKEKIFPSMGELDHELIEQANTLPDLPIVVKQGNRWYLKRSWDAEQTFEYHVARLMGQKLEPIGYNGDLSGEQKIAVEHVLNHPLTIVCGGPGTGKTYTAASLIKQFPGSVLVAAPTGKAAANLRIALPECVVTTLHAMLRSELVADLIVIDEGSMIDAEMMAKLFAAVPTGSRLVMFGDPNQLPPVEAGSLFNDLAQFSSVYLTKCLRTELKTIVDISEAVKKGEMVPFKPLPKLKEAIELIQRSKGVFLTPLRKGIYGVDYLNQSVYQGGCHVPIMITKNDEQMDLYNGDVGVLEGDVACFGSRKIEHHLLPPYTYAYVLSVHKSQGSEYDDVNIFLPEGSERFGREMLYTAVTRAKKSVTIYAAENVLEKVLSQKTHRLSNFSMPSELIEEGSCTCS